jgi:excinuclease ABC subunit C
MIASGVRQAILAAPERPGVYIMKDSRGAVLYVGKAKSLRRRLNNYLAPRDAKTGVLMRSAVTVELRLCASESIALLVEAGLIRTLKPKYNVSLRDDKSFPLVKMTNEPYPCVCITRRREHDGARYFGPYTSARLLRDALKTIRRFFPYRTCSRMPQEACLYYRLGLSPGPCIGRISRAAYARTLENIALLLEGKTDAVVKLLLKRMKQASACQRYEEAGKLRDQVSALSVFERARIDARGTDQLDDLKNLLGLPRQPLRIEAFDVSNIGGRQATASMVSFFMGEPDKNEYRRFRIKTVRGPDDYAMMAEAVRRRYARLKAARMRLPDLILIDGGRGHLETALRELSRLGVDVPVASIAKEFEHVYVKGVDQPIVCRRDTPALNLIRRVRDEAHRFAVAYHHVLRRKRMLGK